MREPCVHIGHQKVISTAVEQAVASGGEAWVFTFHPHPAKILSPETAPPLISTEPCRLRQFEARGKFQSLEKLCGEHGITATAVPPVLFNGERISSTHVRQAVQAGDIPLAEKMLGRPFSIFGTVVNGHGVGRGLGFPTANIAPENELIPAPGVYAAYTRIQRTEDGEQKQLRHPSSGLPSAVFIGERKTFSDHEPVIEAYLLDFDGDLYGQQIEACLVKKIRDAEPFPSKEALIEQIKKDVAQIRGMLNQPSWSSLQKK